MKIGLPAQPSDIKGTDTEVFVAIDPPKRAIVLPDGVSELQVMELMFTTNGPYELSTVRTSRKVEILTDWRLDVFA